MIRRAVIGGTVFWFCLSLGRADEFIGALVKVADGKVTFTRGSGKKKQETTLPAAENCRVVVAKYDAKAKKIEAGDEIAGGLKNAILTRLDKEPVDAWICTNQANDMIVELRLFQTIKKKKS